MNDDFVDDGTFKPADELRRIYLDNLGYKPTDDTIVYCRIGRSSHTSFVLTKLLGFEKVRNYDGSWTEWGNAVRAQIENHNGVEGSLVVVTALSMGLSKYEVGRIQGRLISVA